MSFLGMGNLEVLIVLLVAFIFLGPERMVDAARLLGKAVREVRRMASELPSLDLDESLLEPDETPTAQRVGDRRPTDRDRSSSKSSPVRDNQGSGETSPPPGTPETEEDTAREDTPVAFHPSAQGPAPEEGPQDRT